MQCELDEGPCLDAVHSHLTVISQDLEREKQWPRWTHIVLADLDIRAVMSLWLSSNSRSYGALNLYADRAHAFEPDCAAAQALAAQLSVSVAAQREISERGITMESRTRIGQAQGILMERLGIDPEHAFALLRQLSQCENRRLITICNEIVETRQLPT